MKFQTKNPEIDLAPYMKNTSASFQKFVEDGLARFEKQKRQMNGGMHSTGKKSRFLSKINKILKYSFLSKNLEPQQSAVFDRGDMQSTNFTPEMWMERLNLLKSRANIGTNKGNETKMTDNKVTDENLNMNNQISQRGLINRKEVSFFN